MTIICLSHGSRHPEADACVAEIARAAADLGHCPVYFAHLDFSPSTLTNVAHLVVASGAQQAIVVPLLFTDAFHMRHDVPAAISEAEQASGLQLTLAKGIGTGDDLADILAAHTRSHVVTPLSTDAKVVLYSVGSSTPGANESVARLATALATRLQLNPDNVTAVPATGEHGGPGVVYEKQPDVVVPLFFSPATLLDRLHHYLENRMPQGACMQVPHLGTAIAPLVLARAHQAQLVTVA
ncbi:sirohydrochlorin chelatase [uncultured Corynebacterium sp.]|mgnify:CR=1 FL=1|uniref:sirohydrochlorin chelatase n=1 Tax=uncultured Corynebacterium sp. TaxID=159447 RepID=UPI0025D0F367|nr:CbiX/SirB N-terminal domain-containing protein [uncultured Corynebacterium sp.]